MNVIYLPWNEPTVRNIIQRTFPNESCRDVRAVILERVRFTGTQWDEGSCNTYRLLHLGTMQASSIETAPFFRQSTLHETDHVIPEGFVVVKFHQGRVSYFEIIGPAANINPMLPAPIEMSEDEVTVLAATNSLKSSYAGIKNYRLHEAKRKTGITLNRWEAAKTSLIEKKLLNRSGAITVDGRNALQSTKNIVF